MNKMAIITALVTIIFGVQPASSQHKRQVKQKGYSIKGQLNGLHDGTLLFLTRTSKDETSLDTISRTKSHGEEFEFRGSLSEENEGESYFIFLDTLNAAYKQLKQRYILLHLENSMIRLTGLLDNMTPHGIAVHGSKAHEDLINFDLEYERALSLYRSRYQEVYQTIAKIKRQIKQSKDSSDLSIGGTDLNSARLIELEKEKVFIEQLAEKYKANWIQSYSNSLISPWLLLQTSDSLQKALYPRLTARAQNSYYGMQVRKNIAISNSTQVGRKAPELNLQTPNGQHLSMLNIASQHKLTIVDFWAYWCTPCRKSFPVLKEIYSQYKNKGLEVYGISTDPLKQAWLKALEEDKLPWINVISDEEKTPIKLYGITAIPVYLLLDHEGKILMKFSGMGDKEKAQLKQFLQEHMGS